jgi:hypothetical protein
MIMRKTKIAALVLAFMFIFAACGDTAPTNETPMPSPSPTDNGNGTENVPDGTIPTEAGENLTWRFDSDNLVLEINGTGAMYSHWLSHAGSGTMVPWFHNREYIAEVRISDGVTSIGNAAFSGFENLTDISIPNSMAVIGNHAFLGCISLTSAAIPDGATEIGFGAFGGCISLTDVTIPKSVISIGSEAFHYWDFDFEGHLSLPNLVLHCYENSYAHNYAVQNDISFILLDGS